jgi:hypothetical protein
MAEAVATGPVSAPAVARDTVTVRGLVDRALSIRRAGASVALADIPGTSGIFVSRLDLTTLEAVRSEHATHLRFRIEC